MRTGQRSIPFEGLGGHFGPEDIRAALQVLEAAARPAGDFSPLPEEADFQAALARHEGAACAVAVNSHGAALHLCLAALGVGPGDEVITTPLAGVAAASAVVARGARVVFADIDETTLNLDPASVRKRLNEKTKAIIPGHFAGLAADIDAFQTMARQTGVAVLFDAAHAVGARYQGRPIGGAGRATCYSFRADQIMTCLGDGGAVLTDDTALAEVLRQQRGLDSDARPAQRGGAVGFDCRLTKVQCAVGLSQLAKLDRLIGARQERMAHMHALLAGVDEILRPSGHGPGHASGLYVVRLDTDRVRFSREALRDHLLQRYGVATVVHYPAVWSWEAFQALGYSEPAARCPQAAKAGRQVFSLPIFAHTTEDDCRYIAASLKSALVDLRR